MHKQDIKFQSVPPGGVHRRNAAERAIRTFKTHFIAGLWSVDKDLALSFSSTRMPKLLTLQCSSPLLIVSLPIYQTPTTF